MLSIRNVKSLVRIFLFLIPLFYVTFVYQRLLFDPALMILGETERYDTYPMVEVYESITKFKIFPIWDNHVGSGISAIGHPLYQQTNPLIYPLMFLFNDNFLYAMRIYFFIHLLIAAYSFLFLTMYLKINRLVGIVATIAYIGSFQIIVFTMLAAFRPDMILMAYLPAIFLLLLMALDRRDTLYGILAAAVCSISIQTGAAIYVPIAMIMIVLFFLGYLGLTLMKSSNRINDLFRLSKVLIFFLVFSLGFSAVKSLPVAEFLQNSSRKQFTIEEAEAGLDKAFYEGYLKYNFKEFIPTAFGNVKPILIHKYIITGFFAAVVLSLLSKSGKVVLPIIMTIVMLLVIAGGKIFPVDFYALLYNWVPGFKSFRFPIRFLMPLYFLIPLLFAFGVNALLYENNHLLKRVQLLLNIIKIPILVLLFVGVLIVTYQGQMIVKDFTYSKYTISWFDNLLSDIKQEESESYRMASNFSLFPLDRSAVPVYQITAVDLDNFDSIMNLYDDARPYYYEVHPIPDFSKQPEKLNEGYKKFSLLSVKYLLAPDQDFPKHKYFKDVTNELSQKYDIKAQGRIIEISNPRERISFIPNGILYIGEGSKKDKYSTENIKKIIFDENFNIKNTTVFKLSRTDNKLNDYKQIGSIILDKPEYTYIATRSAQFKINSYMEKPGSLEVNFTTDKGGFFVYSNTYYPGWEAKLDDKLTQVYMADSVVKGVIIPSGGNHQLLLEYKPKSFYIGAVITFFSILFTVIFLLKRKKILRF